MPRKVCPLRKEANTIIDRLKRNKLNKSRMYKMVAGELDRDLLEGTSRLHLALPKAQPIFSALVDAGRNRKKRKEALELIKNAKLRVR